MRKGTGVDTSEKNYVRLGKRPFSILTINFSLYFFTFKGDPGTVKPLRGYDPERETNGVSAKCDTSPDLERMIQRGGAASLRRVESR